MEPGKEGNREAGWGDIALPSPSDGACGSRASLEKAELSMPDPPALASDEGCVGPGRTMPGPVAKRTWELQPWPCLL